MMTSHNESNRRDRGAAMVEFVITFPIILFVALGIIQLALVYSGQQVVHYAAYCAARAELVDQDGERAAEIACTPITSPARGTTSYFVNGIDVGSRMEASTEKTALAGLGLPDVSVIIDHDFELVVPVINKLFVFPNEFPLLPWENEPVGVITANKELTERYGSPHISVRQSVTLPRPWRN